MDIEKSGIGWRNNAKVKKRENGKMETGRSKNKTKNGKWENENDKMEMGKVGNGRVAVERRGAEA